MALSGYTREQSRTSSPRPCACPHFTSKNFVHICLILLPSPPKPSEHIGVHPNADQLLHWPVETPYLNGRQPWHSFRSVGIIDLGIRQFRYLLQFSSLAISEGLRKERARGDSPF